MPGFGALRDLARQQAAGGKRIKTMTIHLPDENKSGEYAVEHEHAAPHAMERFRFARNEGEALAAHLSKHLAITIPGRAKGTIASPESGEVGKGDDE
jgi:hypothetical protein